MLFDLLITGSKNHILTAWLGGPPLPGLMKDVMRARMPGEAERKKYEAWTQLEYAHH